MSRKRTEPTQGRPVPKKLQHIHDQGSGSITDWGRRWQKGARPSSPQSTGGKFSSFSVGGADGSSPPLEGRVSVSPNTRSSPPHTSHTNTTLDFPNGYRNGNYGTGTPGLMVSPSYDNGTRSSSSPSPPTSADGRLTVNGHSGAYSPDSFRPTPSPPGSMRGHPYPIQNHSRTSRRESFGSSSSSSYGSQRSTGPRYQQSQSPSATSLVGYEQYNQSGDPYSRDSTASHYPRDLAQWSQQSPPGGQAYVTQQQWDSQGPANTPPGPALYQVGQTSATGYNQQWPGINHSGNHHLSSSSDSHSAMSNIARSRPTAIQLVGPYSDPTSQPQAPPISFDGQMVAGGEPYAVLAAQPGQASYVYHYGNHST